LKNLIRKVCDLVGSLFEAGLLLKIQTICWYN